jgi:transcriptional regulator with GAF, ATPase, and Fis domain
MRRLANYSWPGNVRELQNVIERAVILSPGITLVLTEELRSAVVASARSTPVTGNANSLDDVERNHIESVLNQARWMIEGDRGAARILGMNPSTLRSRMQKLGIQRPPRVSN